MTDAERIAHLKDALRRIAKPEAFYVATASIDAEAFARMIYAEAILEDLSLERAEQKAEHETRQRYPIGASRKGQQCSSENGAESVCKGSMTT